MRHTLDHAGFTGVARAEASVVIAAHAGPRRDAAAAAETAPLAFDGVSVREGSSTLTLPAESWALVRFTAAG